MTTTKMTTHELWELAVTLRGFDYFGDGITRLEFAAETDEDGEGRAWFGLTPMSMFDDDTWLLGYYGGGSTVAVDLTDDEDEDDRAEKIVSAIRVLLEIKEENPNPEDDIVYVDADGALAWLKQKEKNATNQTDEG